MIITLEGLPYSGKKIQQHRLAKQLDTWGFDPIVMEGESGWNRETSGIINYIATKADVTPVEKLFLFLADRAGFYGRFIPPIYKYGSGSYHDPQGRRGGKPAVVCVGGPDSTLAFQGFGEALVAAQDIDMMNKLAQQGVKIDMTIFIDIGVDAMMKKVPAEERKVFERLGPEYFQRVRDGYHKIAEVESNRVCVIDGSGSEDEIHAGILEDLQIRMKNQKL